MSIDVGYVADNRRFSVAASRDREMQAHSDLIGVVRLRLAHGYIRILGRVDWILNGRGRGLHGSP